MVAFAQDPIRDHERELKGIEAELQKRGIGKMEATRLARRRKVIKEAVKRWTRSGVRGIKQISTRERLCEEVWRPTLVQFVKRTEIGIRGPEREREREEWEYRLNNSR